MSEDPFEFYHSEMQPSERLDIFLLRNLNTRDEILRVTRSQLQRWIAQSGVLLNDKLVYKPGTPVKPGTKVVFTPQYDDQLVLEPFQFPLSIVYEDEELVVVDKPAGLTVHPGAGNPNRTLLNALVCHLSDHSRGFDPSARPGIVHRLDRDTSGLLVIARTKQSLASLSRQFAERTVGRAYQTLVLSTPRAKRAVDQHASGIIDAPLGRDPLNRLKMAVVEAGKPAITGWQVLERLSYANLLRVKLQTGRTHQIRVHMDYAGSPVIGDKSYGDSSALPRALALAADQFGRQALHAYRLEFMHPGTGDRMSFESGLPEDFVRLLQSFREYVS